MRIYIAGKISGLPHDEVVANFWHAAKEAENIHLAEPTVETYIPYGKTPFLWIKAWPFYMIADIWKLIRCDAAYFMANWSDSRGARIERKICEALKIQITDEFDTGEDSIFNLECQIFNTWIKVQRIKSRRT